MYQLDRHKLIVFFNRPSSATHSTFNRQQTPRPHILVDPHFEIRNTGLGLVDQRVDPIPEVAVARAVSGMATGQSQTSKEALDLLDCFTIQAMCRSGGFPCGLAHVPREQDWRQMVGGREFGCLHPLDEKAEMHWPALTVLAPILIHE